MDFIKSLSLFAHKGSLINDVVHKDFRSDLQVLRALAVILVVLFHLDLPFWNGGFTGVDVFYTLSGYLVIGSVFNGCINNKYDYVIFLAGRIKRLFPASFVCLLGIGLIFLVFPIIQQTSGNQGWIDLVWAASHGANIRFFINENQYFRSDNTVSFVLHYWTLALEEQFYLIMPFVIMIYSKILPCLNINCKLSYMIFSLIISIVSFSLCFIPVLSTQKFFLLPYRLWEFLCGSLIALYRDEIKILYEHLNQKILIWIRWLLILGLIICSIYISPNSYPNEMTLVVVLITCAIISFDHPIENELLEAIGNWSYSIYLYHFPIIQLFKFFSLDYKTNIILVILITLILAMASFYYIEQQCLRINVPPIVWFLTIFVFSLALAFTASALFVFPVFKLSTPNNISYYNKTLIDFKISNDELKLLKYNVVIAKYTGYLGHNMDTYFSNNIEFTNIKKINNSGCLLIYGDSNAMQYYPAIIQLSDEINYTVFFAKSFRGDVYDEQEGEAFITHSMMNEDFKKCTSVITLFARTSMYMWTSNQTLLLKRLKRLTDYFGQKGCAIVIDSIPREPGEHDPNKCVSEQLYLKNNFMNCALNKTTSVYDYGINDTLNFNKYLCTDLCPPNYHEIPIYMDQSHLSEAIVFLLSKTFVDEVINMPCVRNIL